MAFTYLALTETNREKEWARQLTDRWAAECEQSLTFQHSTVRLGLSGALWLFSIAIFLIIGLKGGWRYAWIVFIFACGVEALLSVAFAARVKK
ncbi:MAG: hypothetical protein ACM3X4_10175 [Ignavibacteriales bacterium]